MGLMYCIIYLFKPSTCWYSLHHLPTGDGRLSGPTEADYTDDLSSTLLPIGFNIQRLHWRKKVQHRQAKLPWTMYEIINNQIWGFLDQKQQQLCGMDTSSTWLQHWRDERQTCAARGKSSVNLLVIRDGTIGVEHELWWYLTEVLQTANTTSDADMCTGPIGSSAYAKPSLIPTLILVIPIKTNTWQLSWQQPYIGTPQATQPVSWQNLPRHGRKTQNILIIINTREDTLEWLLWVDIIIADVKQKRLIQHLMIPQRPTTGGKNISYLRFRNYQVTKSRKWPRLLIRTSTSNAINNLSLHIQYTMFQNSFENYLARKMKRRKQSPPHNTCWTLFKLLNEMPHESHAGSLILEHQI